MRRIAIRPALLLCVLTLLGATGCQSAGLRFLSLIGLEKEPVVVALVAEKRPAASAAPLEALNPFAPYDALRAELSKELGRPVALDLCFPLQLAPSLSTGMFHLAVVSPGQYAGLAKREQFPVIAVPSNAEGRVTRPALLVVPSGSPVESVEALRGMTVAFGPARDARTHYAAVNLLARHGLKTSDLSLEVLPILGSLKHMPNMRAVAQTVINGSSGAGFIDAAAWAEFPEHDERRGEPARDKLRVIARTAELPDRLILASSKLDQAALEGTREFLLAAGEKHPESLRPLRVAHYAAPTDEILAACAGLLKAEPASKSAGDDARPAAE